jgi:hypothetical protein
MEIADGEKKDLVEPKALVKVLSENWCRLKVLSKPLGQSGALSDARGKVRIRL